MEVAPAHPIFAALSRTRTALNGTMTPVPAGHTQARSVLALAMHLTPELIGSKLTQDYFSPPLIFSKSFLCAHVFSLSKLSNSKNHITQCSFSKLVLL